jgi:hypothetical protein
MRTRGATALHRVMSRIEPTGVSSLSIGVIAWNEEDAIGLMLKSLFRQSLFARLIERNLQCEVICVANGCTDATPRVASAILADQARVHPCRERFSCRVEHLQERGKINAWNQFVHSLSAAGSRFLFLMDGDIVIHHPDTLWNLLEALEANPGAGVSVDQPLKDILFRTRKTVWERISLAASKLTQAGEAQLSGQLYCIRAEVARRIFLPKDLAACEDGFIKALVCSDLLTRPTDPGRIVRPGNATHIFEPYLSIREICRNQKRQVIGQTMVHVLVDKFLAALAPAEKARLAETLRNLDATDPPWLKRLVASHLRRTRHGWQLVPGILGFRLRRLARLGGMKRIACLPAALAGVLATLVACWMARRFLAAGCTEYWPDTRSPNLRHLPPDGESASSRASGMPNTALESRGGSW